MATTPRGSAVGEDTPLVSRASDPTAGPELERHSSKRKEVEKSHSNKFKVVSQLVIAMQRFKGNTSTC